MQKMGRILLANPLLPYFNVPMIFYLYQLTLGLSPTEVPWRACSGAFLSSPTKSDPFLPYRPHHSQGRRDSCHDTSAGPWTIPYKKCTSHRRGECLNLLRSSYQTIASGRIPSFLPIERRGLANDKYIRSVLLRGLPGRWVEL